MKTIYTRAELQALAQELCVRKDWHEPDESGVSVLLAHGNFDNAMLDDTEASVILCQEGRGPIAQVNIALLLAWATGYEGL